MNVFSRSNFCLAFFLTGIFSYSLNAKNCVVMYDHKGHGGIPFILSIPQVVEDPECDSLVLWPPVAALGNLNSKTGIQKISLKDPKTRLEVKEFLNSKNFASQISSFRAGEKEFLEFQKQITTGSMKADKFVFLFHGSSAYIPSLQPTIQITKENVESLSNEELNASQIFSISGGDPDLIEFLKKKLKASADGETYRNSCFLEAQVYRNSEKEKISYLNQRLAPLRSLLKENGKLIGSTDSKKLCSFYTRTDAALKKYFTDKKDQQDCKARFEKVKAFVSLRKCLQDKMAPNLLDSNILSISQESSQNLILSCSIGEEDVSRIIDDQELMALRGCEELKEYKELIQSHRKNASQRTAAKLCTGAANGAEFTVGINLSQVSGLNPNLSREVPPSMPPSFPMPIEVMTLESIHSQLMGSCDSKSVKLLKAYSKEMSEFLPVINLDMPAKDFSSLDVDTATATEAFLNDFVCENQRELTIQEQNQLRKRVFEEHLKLLYQHYLSVSEMNKLSSISFMRRLEIQRDALFLQKTRADLQKQYETLNLSNHESQLRALQRLKYFQEERRKSMVFADCYRCMEGAPQSVSCANMQESYRHLVNIEGRAENTLVRNFDQFAKASEAAAVNAGLAPPLCRLKFPECEFNGTPCLIDEKKPKGVTHKKVGPKVPLPPKK